MSTLFDTLPTHVEFSDHADDHMEPYDRNGSCPSISDHIAADLDQLFERVFLIRNRPTTFSGDAIDLQCGAHLHSNIDNCLWELCGIYLPTQGKISIYRAYNAFYSSSIFIVSPIEWSMEGLQLSN